MRSSQEAPAPHEASSSLHRKRLDVVLGHLATLRVESALDLGCGSGELLEGLLALPRVRRIVGVDCSPLALQRARRRLAPYDSCDAGGRWSLRQGCVTVAPGDLVGFDAAALVETIEHLEPSRLSGLERSIFARLRPEHVMITTPNREYNALYGLAPGELRHPEHRFEWDRTRFEIWAAGVARRHGYDVTYESIGRPHARLGSPTQMALFRRFLAPGRNGSDGSGRLTCRRTASRFAPRRPGR
jgi:small RNA 2'-O-methyltransferase